MLNINKQELNKSAKLLENPSKPWTLIKMQRGWDDLTLSHHALKINCSQMWVCKEAIKTRWRGRVHSELGKSNGSMNISVKCHLCVTKIRSLTSNYRVISEQYQDSMARGVGSHMTSEHEFPRAHWWGIPPLYSKSLSQSPNSNQVTKND